MKKQNAANASVLEILKALAKFDGVHDDIDLETELSIRESFEKQEHAKCIKEIRRMFCLKMRFDVGYVDDLAVGVHPWMDPVMSQILAESEFNCRVREPANVTIPRVMPLFGTDGFNQLSIKMQIGRSLLRGSHERFMIAVAHEMSHVLLHGLKHPLRSSEIATDLLSMIFGFSGARWRIRGYPSQLGYLERPQFEAAYHWIRARQSKTPLIHKLASHARVACCS